MTTIRTRRGRRLKLFVWTLTSRRVVVVPSSYTNTNNYAANNGYATTPVRQRYIPTPAKKSSNSSAYNYTRLNQNYPNKRYDEDFNNNFWMKENSNQHTNHHGIFLLFMFSCSCYRMVRKIADEFLTDERDRKYYADQYTCCPPPLFIIIITLIELGFFAYYSITTGELNPSGPVPIDSVFIYRPDKRLEIWRFLLYMMLHAGWIHLGFNLVVQLLVGLPLEMVHGSARIGCVYMAGVVAGSLGTSVFDTDVYLVGASGGVYALLAAHLSNVLLNYNNMEFGLFRLLGIFIIASCDVGFAIYSRYAEDFLGPPVSYVAHLTGALAGLTIGLLVLKNFEQKLHEQLLWWVALGVYAACTIFAILFNVLNPTTTEELKPVNISSDDVNSQYVYSRLFHRI